MKDLFYIKQAKILTHALNR